MVSLSPSIGTVFAGIQVFTISQEFLRLKKWNPNTWIDQIIFKILNNLLFIYLEFWNIISIIVIEIEIFILENFQWNNPILWLAACVLI